MSSYLQILKKKFTAVNTAKKNMTEDANKAKKYRLIINTDGILYSFKLQCKTISRGYVAWVITFLEPIVTNGFQAILPKT